MRPPAGRSLGKAEAHRVESLGVAIERYFLVMRAPTMRVACMAVLAAACGAPGRPAGPSARPEARVEPCRDPVHPELIGLWGSMTSYGDAPPSFHSVLVYDGCHVTIAYRCPYLGEWWVSCDLARGEFELQFATEREERARGIPEHRHYGEAHRTHAVWRGDVLVSTSEVSVDIEVARLRTDDDGRPTLDSIWDTRRPIPLVRFGPQHALDGRGADLLRAREVVRRPGEWRSLPAPQ
ncbi:MAG TPA: hypothetical protein VIL20_28865 [Sandaracinaceae bacterium]